MNMSPNTPDTPDVPDTHALAERLEHRAGHIDLGPPMLDVVIARGRQRQHRRRTAVGVAAVFGIAGGSVAAVAVLSRPADPDRIAAESTAETTPSTAGAAIVPVSPAPAVADPSPVTFAPSPFAWNRVDPDSAEAVSFYAGTSGDAIAGDGPFVVWSTAPSVSDDYSGVLWRSDDGLTWEQAATPPALVGRGVAEWNGRFLTYGTAPATDADRRNDLAIGTSEDAGRTWTTIVLPLDTSDLMAEAGVTSVGVGATSMAATADGILVSAQVSVNIDIRSKLPAGMRDGSWNITDAGVDVVSGDGCNEATDSTIPSNVSTSVAPSPTSELAGTVSSDPISIGVSTSVESSPTTEVAGTLPPDRFSCTTSTFTWAELGVSARAAELIGVPEVRMFFSEDGVTYTEVDPIGIEQAATDLRLTTLGDSFVASTHQYFPDGSSVSNLYSSPDGREWTSLGSPPVTWVEGFGSFDGRLVVTGYDNTTNTQLIAVLDASGTWTTTSLQSFVLPTDGVLASMGGGAFAVGPSGISMVGALFVDPVAEIGGVTLSRDGVTIEVADTTYAHRVVDDATGQVLATVSMETSSNPDLVAVVYGDRGPMFEVRREAGGEVVTTYTFDELATAVTEATGAEPNWPTIFLLHSRDGVTWSRDSLDEIAGQAITGTGGLRVTDTRVIVSANLANERNPNGSPKQTLLIATPTS